MSFILLLSISLCIFLCIFVVLGHYSRALFIGTIHRCVACRVPGEVCMEPRLVHDLFGCICMLVCMCMCVWDNTKMLRQMDPSQRNSVEITLPLELAQAQVCVGELFSFGRLQPKLKPLSFSISLSLSRSFFLSLELSHSHSCSPLIPSQGRGGFA